MNLLQTESISILTRLKMILPLRSNRFLRLPESIQIVVYDKLGRIIETESISNGGNGKVQISLNEYVTVLIL